MCKISSKDKTTISFGWWWYLIPGGSDHTKTPERENKINQFGMTDAEMIEETLKRR